jgi:hypothetical protein
MALSKIDADGVSGLQASLTAATTVPSEGGAVNINLVEGLTKAWVNFSGNGTLPISESFNVASLTDNDVGRYSANYVNSMNTSTYATQVCSDADSSNDAFNRVAGGANTTTSKAYLMHFENGSSQDTSIMIGTINGDLA